MPSNNAVELKGGLYTFMSLRLITRDLDAVEAAIADKVQQAPAFFRDTPVVVDLGELDEDVAIDGAALLACIRRHRLHPVVASIGERSSPLAESITLPLVEAGARRRDRDAGTGGADRAADDPASRPTEDAAGAGRADTPANDPSDEAAGGSAAQEPGARTPETRDSITALSAPREVEYVVRTPLLVDRPVRSGQQLYARDTDLIIMGQVGPGAEVIADNNIHVYGPLRGRALCGVSGNADTRIFCQSLEAELVSVAGVYRMLETIPEELRGKPAQIWLDNDRLAIEPL